MRPPQSQSQKTISTNLFNLRALSIAWCLDLTYAFIVFYRFQMMTPEQAGKDLRRRPRPPAVRGVLAGVRKGELA